MFKPQKVFFIVGFADGGKSTALSRLKSSLDFNKKRHIKIKGVRLETFDQSNCDRDFNKYKASVIKKLKGGRNLLAPLCIDRARLKNGSISDIVDFVNKLNVDVYFFIIPEAKSKKLSIPDISEIINNSQYEKVVFSTTPYPNHYKDLHGFLKIYV